MMNAKMTNTEAIMNNKDLGPGLNWKQVVKILGCSRSQFYKLVDEGKFPNAYRLGQTGVRVPQADVYQYREDHRVWEY